MSLPSQLVANSANNNGESRFPLHRVATQLLATIGSLRYNTMRKRRRRLPEPLTWAINAPHASTRH